VKDRQQNTTTRPIPFLMIDSVDHISGKCGLTPTVRVSKDGGLWAAPAGAVTELSVAAPAFAGSFTGASSTGGFLAQSTQYFYKVTALNGVGESTPSAEQSYTTPASGTATNQVTVNWTASTGATGYSIYRSTTTGTEQLLATVGAVTSYADTTNTTPAGSLPTMNTTSGGSYVLAGNATDRNTLGAFRLRATGAGADPVDEDYTIVAYDPFDGAGLGLSRLDAAVSGVPAAVGAIIIEGTKTLIQCARGWNAALLNKVSGATSSGGNPKFRDMADSKDVINALVDQNGNRTQITLDLS
jgi:hypothetical protein